MNNESNEEIETGVSSEPRVGYLKTYPIEFGERRWWLTEEEMDHLKPYPTVLSRKLGIGSL